MFYVTFRNKVRDSHYNEETFNCRQHFFIIFQQKNFHKKLIIGIRSFMMASPIKSMLNGALNLSVGRQEGEKKN